MSATQIGLLVAAALIVFWMVGAYNRLVALRNAIGAAWLQVAEVLQRRGDALLTLLTVLRGPMAAEQGALDALDGARVQVMTAAAALGQRPVGAPQAAALVGAESALAASASRVLALLEQHAELKRETAVLGPATQLADSNARLAFTRQLYNQATAAYNEAIAQFPTRWLARLYRFGAAGRL